MPAMNEPWLIPAMPFHRVFALLDRKEWEVHCMSAGGRDNFAEVWQGRFRRHTVVVRFRERSLYNDTFETNSGERLRTGGRREDARYLDAEVTGLASPRDLFDLARWIARDKPKADRRPVRARFEGTPKEFGQLVRSPDDVYDASAYTPHRAPVQVRRAQPDQLSLAL